MTYSDLTDNVLLQFLVAVSYCKVVMERGSVEFWPMRESVNLPGGTAVLPSHSVQPDCQQVHSPT